MANISIKGKLLVDQNIKGYNIKIPNRYLQDIFNANVLKSNDIPIFQVFHPIYRAGINFYLVVSDYYEPQNYENDIYVSHEIFHKIKHYKDANQQITIKFNTHINTGTEVTLKPLDFSFFSVRDQMSLLMINIGSSIRILYPGQIFKIKCFELDCDLYFEVLSTNNESNIPILVVETNLEVNFNCESLLRKSSLPRQFQNSINIDIPKTDNAKCACYYIEKYSGSENINTKCINCNPDEDDDE